MITYDLVEAAFDRSVYGKSTMYQTVVYQLGLTGIPIANVNNKCVTGSTPPVRDAALIWAYDMLRAL